jgi:putative Mg2+ transporter-C (MgtC) family protein
MRQGQFARSQLGLRSLAGLDTTSIRRPLRRAAILDRIISLEQLDLVPHLTVLAIAYLFALPIGWNRECEERSAGLRTFPLVAVSCCGFVQAAEVRLSTEPGAISAVIEGLITGIGFIGGGAILKNGNSVKGTATAASLWATGAIGTAVGLGSYDVGAVIALLTVISLIALPRLKPRPDGEPEIEHSTAVKSAGEDDA